MFGRKTLSCTLAGLMLGLGSYALAAPEGEGEKPRQERQQRDGERAEKEGERKQREAQGEGERRGEPGMVLRGLLRDLDLSDAQKTAIHEHAKSFGDKVKAFRDEHKDEIESLRKELQEAREAKDREKAEAVLAKMKALHEQAPKVTELLTAVRGELTDAQRPEFDARVEKFKAEMEERREERRPEGRGEGDGPKREKKKDGGDGAKGDGQMDI